MPTATARTVVAIISVVAGVQTTFAADELPRAIDSRLKIELFAEHPDIVTPTGIDVDHAGRVWAIESNTHFPPAGYKGHPSDRILVMQDTTGDHKADKITLFTDGLKHTMSIAVKPVWLNPRLAATQRGARSDVFIATRRAIWLFTDTDGDLKADKKTRIIQLETKGDYPHNGLAGFAFDAMGWMYFGFGENLGADYKVIGSDGVTLSGGAEGGNIYRCRPDGSKLKQWATGFWNPHASCVDAFGRLFTVDNDPDSRPPCRLLHIIEGGDYGFHFRNGRKGLHPFTAWNGEIPGTLPMVSGTGEAPSGIVAYESDGFPKDYLGNLLVGSWGDHRIDRFRLKPRGASFESLPETIIQGGEEFRPVGIAVAPDGSLFCTDWVKRDYKLHGHGRVWRISMKEEVKREVVDVGMITSKVSNGDLREFLKSPRLEVRRVAARAMSSTKAGRETLVSLLGKKTEPVRQRIEALWAAAHVPVEVENFDFMRLKSPLKPGPARIACRDDDVGFAALRLLGTSQFPLEFPFRAVVYDHHSFLKNCGPPPKMSKVGFRGLPPDLYRRMLNELPHAYLNKFGGLYYMAAIETNDPYLLSAMIEAAPKSLIAAESLRQLLKDDEILLEFSDSARHHLAWLLVARRMHPKGDEFAKLGLDDSSPSVRRAAVQWVAEENLKDLRPQVEAILDSKSMTTDLFLATLAALEMLDGKDPKDFDKTPAGKYVLPLVKDEKRSPAVRAQALRLVDENDPALTKELMSELLASKNYPLRLETVRTLQFASSPHATKLLIKVAKSERPWRKARDEKDGEVVMREYFNHRRLMLESILGLANAANQNTPDKDATSALLSLLDESLEIRIEVIRSLRTVAKTNKKVRSAILDSVSMGTGHPDWWEDVHEHLHILLPADSQYMANLERSWKKRPSTTEKWVSLAQKTKTSYDGTKKNMGLDAAESGRRVFFHPNGAGCSKCHTVNGRGGNIGPDLSRIGGALNRKRLAESILEPSKEIAPQFTNWTFVMTSGKVHNGIILGDTRDKKQTIGTAEGVTLDLPTAEIEVRQPQKKSIMPDKLIDRLTVGEFRDLLAFLESLK